MISPELKYACSLWLESLGLKVLAYRFILAEKCMKPFLYFMKTMGQTDAVSMYAQNRLDYLDDLTYRNKELEMKGRIFVKKMNINLDE